MLLLRLTKAKRKDEKNYNTPNFNCKRFEPKNMNNL